MQIFCSALATRIILVTFNLINLYYPIRNLSVSFQLHLKWKLLEKLMILSEKTILPSTFQTAFGLLMPHTSSAKMELIRRSSSIHPCTHAASESKKEKKEWLFANHMKYLISCWQVNFLGTQKHVKFLFNWLWVSEIWCITQGQL
mgnify:CR=1 FL=1